METRELRKLFDKNETIKERVRDYLRISDEEFACDQMEELRDVIRFDTDAWDNVWASPAVYYDACGELSGAVRNSIYSYPAKIENELQKLERYQEGVDRVGIYDIPNHFICAIEKTMQAVCDVYAEYIHADLTMWLDYSDDDLFEFFEENPLEFAEFEDAETYCAIEQIANAA